MPHSSVPTRHAHLAALGLAAGSIALAACSSSGHSTSSGSTGSQTSSSAAPGSSSTATSAPAGVTINTADVAGYGTVLAASSGRTLYILSSERGGKITCTDDNGCTKICPDTELPGGVMAATPGAGVDKSLLGTVKDASGSLYVTYGGWPLYTFAGDNGPAQANGQGISSFGGTWYVLGVSGQPVTAKS